MDKNSMVDIKAFFARDARELPMAEWGDFWKSLTDEEKDYYKNADLS